MTASSLAVSEAQQVLIVEDEEIVAMDIAQSLEKSGFAVVGTAASASEAFQKIEVCHPDLVLMDIRIRGELDGIHAAKVIRSQYGIPVVFMTAHSDEATVERALTTSPFGYLTKPLRNGNLKATVSSAISNHREQHQMQKSRALLFDILQSLPDAVFVAEKSGEVLFVNRAAEQLTGWQLQDAASENVFKIATMNNNGTLFDWQDLLREAERRRKPVSLPNGSRLQLRSGGWVEVTGRLSRVSSNQHTPRIFLSLQEIG